MHAIPPQPPLRFRKAAAQDEVVADSPWQTDLASLSGGQRTLVSLALLLSAARAAAAGAGGCGLFILDEADAALDEHNQARAGLEARSGSRGAPKLCATRSTAFSHIPCPKPATPHCSPLTLSLYTPTAPTHTHPTPPQRRMAELLMELAREGPAQVLCVSHNAAFQAACDGSLSVTGPGAGGRPAAQAGAAPAAQGAGKQRAGGAGKAKRQRVHFAVS